MQDLERVQAVEWSVCRKVGTCAARSERAQRGRTVCSEVGPCAGGWSVCSEVGACAARLERVQRGLRDFQKIKIIKAPCPPAIGTILY